MESVPTQEPKEATCNDTLAWQKFLPAYPPAEGWALSYALRGPESHDLTAEPDAEGYRAGLSAPATPGLYALQGFVAKEGKRVTVYTGTLALSADLSGALAGHDPRTPNRRILDAIDAAIAGRASRSDLEYEIDTGASRRRLKSVPLQDLVRVRGIYAQKVWRDEHPEQLAPGVKVSFGREY